MRGVGENERGRKGAGGLGLISIFLDGVKSQVWERGCRGGFYR